MFSLWLLLLVVAPYAANASSSKLLKISLTSKLVPPGSGVSRRANTSPLHNDIVKVITPVQCGNGQTFSEVLIDTGSSILWVGGEQQYQTGPNTQELYTSFSVGYGTGDVSGNAVRDTVVVGNATATGQILGVANKTQGFTLVAPFDGILGLGPSGSNSGDVAGMGVTPTFVETLFAEKVIDQAMFGIYISPIGINGVPRGQGEIAFGGVDQSLIQSAVAWVPQNTPVNFHWEFNAIFIQVSSFSFGTVTLGPAPARTDTGALAIAIPFDQFFGIVDTYKATIANDNSALTSFLSFPSNASSTLPSLNFTIGTATFSIPPSSYIVPTELYQSLNITRDPTVVRTWIASGGPGEYGLGQKWLENVYTAYDLTNHLIGFAQPAPPQSFE